MHAQDARSVLSFYTFAIANESEKEDREFQVSLEERPDDPTTMRRQEKEWFLKELIPSAGTIILRSRSSAIHIQLGGTGLRGFSTDINCDRAMERRRHA